MSLTVCKFGGSSLADGNNIQRVADIVENDPGRRFVVVSAPGKRYSGDIKVTDLLYECYKECGQKGNCSESFAKMTFFKPLLMSSLVMAIPAAPEPLTTTERSSIFLPTSFNALIMAASVTTAVPC